jgi:lysophospholipase L1-like esterase
VSGLRLPLPRPGAGRWIFAVLAGACASSGALLFASASAAQSQDYLAFGDSITAGSVGDDPSRPDPGYPARLEDRLRATGADADVDKSGVGGEDTSEGLTRIDSVLATTTASVLLLMEGTNDIANDIGPETTRFNLNQMAIKAQDAGLSVIHATLIPRLPDARFDPDNVNNLHTAQEIRDLAGRRGRKLADPFEVFGSTPDLFVNYYYQGEDPVGHPNAAGYELLADIFFEVIRDIDRVPPVIGISAPEHAEDGVPATTTIELDVWDFGSAVDLANTTLLVDDEETGAVAVATSDPKRARISYQPASPLDDGMVRLRLRARDTAATPNAVDREVMRFLVSGMGGPLVGDVDDDGRVDGRDLIELARRFGTVTGDPLFAASVDLNGDGAVDGVDLAMLADNFGHGG